jgi:predicted nuclease of predicted toxin-antitoxin system
VNLLLDENLSPRLVPRLLSLFAGLKHVRNLGLQQAEDKSIWNWAKANAYTVVTTDYDFVTLSKRLGWPPKVIHIEHCDFPFRIIENLLRRSAVLITEFEDDSSGVLTLRVEEGQAGGGF